MNNFSRLLGIFFVTAMIVASGSFFLFEHNTSSSRIAETTLSSSIKSPADAGTGTTTRAATAKEFPLPKQTGRIGGTVIKERVVAPTSENTTAKTTTTSSVSLPGPLIVAKASSTTSVVVTGTSQSPDGVLNQMDIIALTNKERVAVGLPPLSFNSLLTVMATAKANDMIEKQYFAHVSPTGIDLTMLAKTYGYVYLNVGENLALGDFVSSRDVVLGWMNSPGHRANILSKNFTEIGVSAILGNYEGRNAWYVVQEFGRPLSDCPLPDTLLKKKIEIYQTEIDALAGSLANLKTEIDAPNLDQGTYNAKVKDYNSIIDLYNQLVTTIKQYIQSYNSQVEVYSACAGN